VIVEQFATEANVKQAVTYWLHTLDTTSFHARNTSLSVRVEQMLKCQWWLRGSLVCTICYLVPRIQRGQSKVFGNRVFGA